MLPGSGASSASASPPAGSADLMEGAVLARKSRALLSHARRHGWLAGGRLLVRESLAQAGALRVGICYALEDAAAKLENLPPVAGLQIRRLHPDEARVFGAAGEDWFLPGYIEQSLQRGDDCFGAFVDGTLACSGWYARAPILQFGGVIGFPDDVVWEHRIFTRPEFRGRGLAASIKAPAARHYREQGRTTMLATVEWTNDASRCLYRRLGSRAIATILQLGRGRPSRTWLLGGAGSGLHLIRHDGAEITA
jgi:GNAT superfamily N-acetyltransferase